MKSSFQQKIFFETFIVHYSNHCFFLIFIFHSIDHEITNHYSANKKKILGPLPPDPLSILLFYIQQTMRLLHTEAHISKIFLGALPQFLSFFLPFYIQQTMRYSSLPRKYQIFSWGLSPRHPYLSFLFTFNRPGDTNIKQFVGLFTQTPHLSFLFTFNRP